MAQTDFIRLNLKPVYVMGFVCVLMMIQKGDGFEFKVGGGWSVPSDPNSAIYNQWAEKNRFQIGDTLLFVYAANKDSVLQVTKDDYTNCNTASPLEKFTDGHTVIKLNQSGPHYFISGVADNCHKNEKMHIVVLADRTKTPSKGAPAPAGEESPPPPPPSDEHNSASSIVSCVFGIVACFIVSFMI